MNPDDDFEAQRTEELVQLVLGALELSDLLKYDVVGIHLDAALHALTGKGVAP